MKKYPPVVGKRIKARDSQRRFAPFNFNLETWETPGTQADLSYIPSDREVSELLFFFIFESMYLD